jgi:hypothetical protein
MPRILDGFSFSALFGVYSLLHRPDTFSGYLLGSPSLWWHDRLAFTWEQEYASTHEDLAARAFLFVGADEHPRSGEVWMNERLPAAVLEQLRQVDNFNELPTRLRRRSNPEPPPRPCRNRRRVPSHRPSSSHGTRHAFCDPRRHDLAAEDQIRWLQICVSITR